MTPNPHPGIPNTWRACPYCARSNPNFESSALISNTQPVIELQSSRDSVSDLSIQSIATIDLTEDTPESSPSKPLSSRPSINSPITSGPAGAQRLEHKLKHVRNAGQPAISVDPSRRGNGSRLFTSIAVSWHLVIADYWMADGRMAYTGFESYRKSYNNILFHTLTSP
jgi:hypothetical protein